MRHVITQGSADLHDDSVPAPGSPDRRWLLYASGAPGLRVDDESGAIHCHLCRHCKDNLRHTLADGKPTARKPYKARANGLWGGPEPEEIRCLTYAERRVLRLARVYASVKRVLEKDALWARGNTAALPQYSTRNVVAYMQDPDTARAVLCLSPSQLCQDLYIQFEGSDRSVVAREPMLIVDLEHLRRALWWFTTHCWEWLVATKDQHVLNDDSLGKQLERRLSEYQASLGGASSGVPSEIVSAATSIDPQYTSVNLPGPADAVANSSDSDCFDVKPDAATKEGAPSDKRIKRGGSARVNTLDSSAAVLDSGLDEMSPIALWNRAMEKYGILQGLGRAHANAPDDTAEKAELQALAEAVQALKALEAAETQEKLKEFCAQYDGDRAVLRIGHEGKPLNTFRPDWWVVTFTDLFYRGDCKEQKGLKVRSWAKVLMQRHDFPGWATSKEFAASAMNIAIRRAQMWAVYRYCAKPNGPFNALRPLLLELKPDEFLKAALYAGECATVRDALRKKNIDVKVKNALRSMDIAMRGVEGTEAERELFRLKFGALRIWNGCSSLFFHAKPTRQQVALAH